MNRLPSISVLTIATTAVAILGLTGCAADQTGPRGRHEVSDAGPPSPLVAPSPTPSVTSHTPTPDDAQAVAQIAQALEAPHRGNEHQPASQTSSPDRDAGQTVVILRHAAPSVHGLDRTGWPAIFFATPIGQTTHFPTYTKFSEVPVSSPILFEPSVPRSQRIDWALSGSQSGMLDDDGAWQTVKELAHVAGDLALFPVRVFITPPWTVRTTP